MTEKGIKVKIFAEYLYCLATNGEDERFVTLENIEYLVDNGYLLKLKSVYDMTQEDMFEIAEEMRYNRYLEYSFKDFRMSDFRVVSESRNHSNLYDAMISYTAKTDDGYKGDWFRLMRSFGVNELKSKGYDVGSAFSYKISRGFKERMSLEDFGLAIIKKD